MLYNCERRFLLLLLLLFQKFMNMHAQKNTICHMCRLRKRAQKEEEDIVAWRPIQMTKITTATITNSNAIPLMHR